METGFDTHALWHKAFSPLFRIPSDIIGRHFCKFLDLTNPLNDVNPRHQDILLLGHSCYLRLLCVDNNDQAFLISVHLFEGLPALDELKGLRPIQLVPVPHYCLI